MGEEEDEFRTAMTLELVGLIMVSVLVMVELWINGRPRSRFIATEEPGEEGEGLMVENPRVYRG